MLSTSERGQLQPCEACIKPQIKTMNLKLHKQLRMSTQKIQNSQINILLELTQGKWRKQTQDIKD